jgi:hypothetical protein
MADSFILYNGDGSTQNFTVPFGYLDEDHVTIQEDGVEIPSTWVNSTTIRATAAPAVGTSNVKVVRVTPTDALVTYSDGAGLTAADLNTSNLQSFYVAEETRDAYEALVLTNDSVATANLENLSVTTAKINDLAVTTAKINDLGVTTGKIAALAVTTAKINALAVTSAELAADAVTTAKILNANVTQEKLAYPAGYTGYMLIRDEKAVTTAGGASVATTWTKRVLNTEVADTGSHSAIASDVITLLAGTYRVRATAPFHGAVGYTRLRLRNTSDNTTAVVGGTIVGVAAQGALATLVGRFTIAATKTFELQYYCAAVVATNGLGLPSAAGAAEVEVYSEIEFIRE